MLHYTVYVQWRRLENKEEKSKNKENRKSECLILNNEKNDGGVL